MAALGSPEVPLEVWYDAVVVTGYDGDMGSDSPYWKRVDQDCMSWCVQVSWMSMAKIDERLNPHSTAPAFDFSSTRGSAITNLAFTRLI